MDKKTARQLVRAKKKQMTLEKIKEKSQEILKRVVEEVWFLQADCIYCYVSYNQEVMTRSLITTALEEGKQVAVPKVIGKEMEFFYISSVQDLEEGYQGIPEPKGNDMADPVAERKAGKNNLMVLPGLAFDNQCNRVGYGGGFYDRYLEKYQEAEFQKVAIAFDFQVVDEIEMEACDWRVDKVVTNERCIEA